MKSDIKLLYIDLFCGAGGTSTGVEKATFHGTKCAKVIACVNHDANAIASHAAKMKAAVKQEQSSSLELPSESRFGEAKAATKQEQSSSLELPSESRFGEAKEAEVNDKPKT